MIQAIAIDDEPLALKVIEHHCKKTAGIKLEKTFTNLQEAYKYLEEYPVDLLFLDIEMPQQNGVDFYKSLSVKPSVIFTTAYDHYAIEGFNVNAVDYILKPISLDRFQTAVEKTKNYLEKVVDYLMIRADYKLYKVDYSEILYIESLDDYIQIYLNSKSKIIARMSMKNIIEKLPSEMFIRIHRSYIIPTARVQSIKNKQIVLPEITLPVGETFRENVLKKFENQ
ncbi:LytR/AlgR family response regulator transcription factor [Avrilella dinanensis]|uniref:DNA-binding response regulator n=1 Tax=Avrilella dinanensis TaxID=2008672 RepID=A0A2M9R6V1_9FLAO|nr:LytTR family DNA-binding domain-containing protein [Avrilella dinanensis]PJR04574.1 DNA-binding response regulator [Avrilella dinanensis]